MSIRHQDIIDRTKTRLQGIKKTAGYYTDAGSYVEEWRDVPLTDLTMHLNVKDGPETIDSVGAAGPLGVWNRTLHVRVICECAKPADGTDAFDLLGKLVADVVKAVGVDQTWGGIALYTEIDQGKPEMQQTERKIAAQTITLAIYYRTAPGSPDDTPIIQSFQTVAAPTTDKTSALVRQMQAQVAAAFASLDVSLWHVVTHMISALPTVEMSTEENQAPSEMVSGSNNLEDRTITVTSTIAYKGKDTLATLRAENEVLLTAIETDPKLGGLAVDCIPKSTELAMDQEEIAIIGITVMHEILYQATKWEN